MARNICYNCFSGKILSDRCIFCGYSWKDAHVSHDVLPAGTILNGRYEMGVPHSFSHSDYWNQYVAQELSSKEPVQVWEYYPFAVAYRREGQTNVSFSQENRQIFEEGQAQALELARFLYGMLDTDVLPRYRDCFYANGTFYLVTEHPAGKIPFGRDILTHLQTRPGQTAVWSELWPLLRPAVQALARCHAMGVSHQKLIPENLVMAQGKLRVMHTGECFMHRAAALADHMSQMDDRPFFLEPWLPLVPPKEAGTPACWADVYALGAVILHALTGAAPPDFLNRRTSQIQIFSDLPRGKLGPNCRRVLEQALEWERGRRFESMGQFLMAMDQADQADRLHPPARFPNPGQKKNIPVRISRRTEYDPYTHIRKCRQYVHHYDHRGLFTGWTAYEENQPVEAEQRTYDSQGKPLTAVRYVWENQAFRHKDTRNIQGEKLPIPECEELTSQEGICYYNPDGTLGKRVETSFGYVPGGRAEIPSIRTWFYTYDDRGTCLKAICAPGSKADGAYLMRKYKDGYPAEESVSQDGEDYKLQKTFLYDRRGNLLERRVCHRNGQLELQTRWEWAWNGALKRETHYFKGEIASITEYEIIKP